MPAKVGVNRNPTQPKMKKPGGTAAKSSLASTKSVAGAKGKPKGSKKKSTGSRASKQSVDIFSNVAMENAMYICHTASDCLAARGFPWQGMAKKRKGKGKKKRK